ncbi:MAG: tetratricopeptide repeat protein, partial [Lysobacterales bacterium]
FLPLMSTVRPRLRPVWGVALAVIIAAMVLPAPSNLFKELFQDAHPNADIVYYKEGKVANVLVYDFKKLGYKDFHLNAVNEASSRLWHVQLFKMLGLLPTLVHDNPTDALMIAFGAGMSAGATARNVESLDCVDLNPDIAGIAAAYTRENLDVINQPNFHQIVNDGRNALLLNPRKYSLIISDATNPKMFDSWTLYSREFYQLVKDRLKPGGVFCQWAVMPLPGDAIKVILNTFRSVFPHMSFWSIHGSSQVLMLGTPERLEIDYADLAKRLEPLYDDAGLAEFGIDTPEKFLSFFLLGEDGVSRMLTDFDKISTDDLPHAQFYINQDSTGTDNCLDLVRYQESIVPYMKKASPVPAAFAKTMTAYEDIARRLNIGWLIGDLTRFAEAAVVADDAGLDDANVAHHLNYCPEKKRHFQARLETHPDDVTARNWLGSIHLKRGEYEQAEKEFKTVIALKPDHTFARMNLAMTYLETGRIDSAVAAFLEVRKLSTTRNMLKVVNQQLGKARILRKMAYQPDSPELARSLGIAYYNEGRILDAVRAYRRAAELSGNDPSILYNLALICERHEFVPEAARLYEKLSAAQIDHQAIAASRNLFTGLAQDPAQLRGWLNDRLVVPEPQEATDEHPPSCDEALALWNKLDPDGAVDTTDLRRAAQLYEQSTVAKPDDLHAYADAAVLYEELHDFERAAELWNGALQIRPDLTFIPDHIKRLASMAELQRDNTSGTKKAALLRDVARNFRT